jgi:hypothetical protein
MAEAWVGFPIDGLGNRDDDAITAVPAENQPEP